MKNRLIALLTTASIGLLPQLLLTQTEPPQMNNLAVTDLSVSSAIISWTTDQKTSINKIQMTSVDSTWEVLDSYGWPGYTHIVEVKGLERATTYSYKIISGETVWDNDGAGYSFSTLDYIPTNPLPILFKGKISNKWGSPIDRCLIRVYLYNQYEGLSLPRVVSSEADGDWDANIGIMISENANGQVQTYGDGAEIVYTEYVANYWTTDIDTVQITSNVVEKLINVIDPNATGEPGDVDGNGTLNIFDLLELLKVLGGKINPNPQQLAASDVNANGKVDIFDLLELLKKMKTAKS